MMLEMSVINIKKYCCKPLFVIHKKILLVAVAAVAAAAPEEYSKDIIPIVKDVRVQEDDGRYSLDVETGNGIFQSQSGSPDGVEGSVIKAGEYA